MRAGLWIGAIALTQLFAAPAALAFLDVRTGLEVNPPAPFVAEDLHRPGHLSVQINPTTGVPHIGGAHRYLCIVDYLASPRRNKLTQAQVNNIFASKGYLPVLKQRLESDNLKVLSVGSFDIDGVHGLEALTLPTNNTGADNERIFYSYIETPRGETELDCFGVAEELDMALPLFHAIRASIKPPR